MRVGKREEELVRASVTGGDGHGVCFLDGVVSVVGNKNKYV